MSHVRKESGYLSNGTPAYVHAVDKNDQTPAHRTYPTGYDSRCGWCWLNAPHTEAMHADRVAAS